MNEFTFRLRDDIIVTKKGEVVEGWFPYYLEATKDEFTIWSPVKFAKE